VDGHANLDRIDRAVLTLLQEGLPLEPHPLAALAFRAGIPEGEFLSRAIRWKEEGLIRDIRGIFDARALGYSSLLVAAQLDPTRVDEAAETVNRHPGVSHNYLREGRFNLWFTLAVPPGKKAEEEAEELVRAAGGEDWLPFPALKVFKVRAVFELGENGPGHRQVVGDSLSVENRFPSPNSGPDSPAAPSLSSREIAAVRALQEDFPLVPDPFRELGERAGFEEQELIGLAVRLRDQGRLRRIAATLRHRRAGFRANAMVVWEAEGKRAEAAGWLFASHPRVSHCYLRPTYPEWPYGLFTMMHASSREELEETVSLLSRESGLYSFSILWSLKEYKKERIRYF